MPERVSENVPILVADSLAARQWEIHLVREQLRRGDRAWISPTIVAYGRWADRVWSDSNDGKSTALNAFQSFALWRRIIAESVDGDRLIGTAGAARWSVDAWSLLWGWRIDPERLRAEREQADFRAFLAWSRTYRERLREASWIDHAQIDAALSDSHSLACGDLVLADLEHCSPAQQAVFSRFERAGATIARWTAPQVAESRRRIRLADNNEELHVAAGWAKSRLDSAAERRIALVIAGLSDRYSDVERVLANVLGHRSKAATAHRFATPLHHRLDADPLIGAALTGIELLSPRGTFGTFSRWLRSAFFHGVDPLRASSNALLESRLRDEVSAQLGFLQAYREAGLASRLRREAPDLARALDEALREIGSPEQSHTPSRWARRWQRALQKLGWPADYANHETLQAWETALDDFAQLTPVLDSVPAGRALRELQGIVELGQSATPWPLFGVHVFEHIDDVGPGYDCAWVTGFTDAHWPQPVRINPLLPRSLQLEHAMPWCSPQAALARSEHSLRRLAQRVPELVISWPGRVYDYPTEPSPLLRPFPDSSVQELEAGLDQPRASRGPGARAKQTVPDVPPPVADAVIRGGTGALDAQARCPLRAFCEYRLAARPLEPASFGLAPRLQGITAHRALELLLERLPSQAELLSGPARAATTQRAAQCVERALAESFGPARQALETLFELERERLWELIEALLDRESERSAFQIAAVEQRQNVQVGPWVVGVRIDRLDRLSDGSLAIIDYKTGRHENTADWFKERLHDTQIPLYAQHLRESLSAAVIVTLRSRGVAYSGVWHGDAAFPGRARKLAADRSWRAQLELWRQQTEQLVDEFTSGDTRVRIAEPGPVEGAYAPLTRIYEQLALHRARATAWPQQ